MVLPSVVPGLVHHIFLLLLPLLALCAPPLASAAGASSCRISDAWAANHTNGAQTWVVQLLPPPADSSAPCRVLANIVGPDVNASLAAVDVATGEQVWQWPLPGGLPGSPVAASASGDLFVMTEIYSSYNLTRLSADRLSSGRPVVVWTAGLGRLDFYAHTLVFAAAGAAQRETLLVVGEQWTVLDAQSGAVLRMQQPPYADALEEVAILGDSADHRFVVRSDSGTFATYQLQADGSWQQLASAAYDHAAFAPVTLTDGLAVYGRRSRVAVLQGRGAQSNSSSDSLYGLDLQTGKTAWNASGYALLNDEWVQPYKGYTVGRSWLEPHPVRADWVLIGAYAINAAADSGISAFGLLNSATGRVVATSAPAFATADQAAHWYAHWQAVHGGEVIARRLDGNPHSAWLALNATTLATVSSGVLPDSSLNSQIALVDAQPGEVSVVASGTNSTHGVRVTSTNTICADTAADRRSDKLSKLLEQVRRAALSSLAGKAHSE